MPYPLPLLPVTDKDLSQLDSREALLYQNSLMKNALIRGLNNSYAKAAKIQAGKDRDLHLFIEYVQIVCEMLRLHVEGDRAFFTKHPASSSGSLDDLLGKVWSQNAHRDKLVHLIGAWEEDLQVWQKTPTSYQGALLRKRMEEMEVPLLKGAFELVHCIKPEVVATKFDSVQIQDMVKENIEWLVTNSDAGVLIPYCISHHDVASNKYWPLIIDEGYAAVPKLIEGRESVWALSPFDPVKRTSC